MYFRDLQNDLVDTATGEDLHEAVSGLREEFMECIDCLESLQNIEIILCGGTGEGKSSLINNCMAAISGSYANVADHGGAAVQVTKMV
ncbi:hypothetical protein CHS0354_000977 [Potamilus streckersoni]|uniref:Uncharacterized protein n=1 Tax=Potamilus streckersoni TaxID=2493646 RepID=A0AAE0SI35_9BIVA|nr:hypothetical protein CHS0354_000977 [Potamilus streckersoni]